MNGVKKAAAALLAVFLLLSAAASGETAAEETIIEKDGWSFNDKGFLAGENPGEEYVLEDEKKGVWQYASADLAIRINRFEETEKVSGKKLTRRYYVAEIYATPESPVRSILNEPNEKLKLPEGCHVIKADTLLKNHPAVLAVSDDYFGYRYQTQKSKKGVWPTGIIIRDGMILHEKTRDSSKKAEFPPLDTLAVYADGSMKTYVSDELTPEEYIAQGAVHVLSFGPWLLRNGEPNPKAGADGKKATYTTLNYSEARTAIGMVEPYHYIILTVARPNTNKFIGAKGAWLIAKMQEYGCTEALNLDGGGTTCLAFNGKIIMRGPGSSRPLGSMIAFGLRN